MNGNDFQQAFHTPPGEVDPAILDAWYVSSPDGARFYPDELSPAALFDLADHIAETHGKAQIITGTGRVFMTTTKPKGQK